MAAPKNPIKNTIKDRHLAFLVAINRKLLDFFS